MLTILFCFPSSSTAELVTLVFLGSTFTSLTDHKLLVYLVFVLLLAFPCLVFRRVLSSVPLLCLHKWLPWCPFVWFNCPFRQWHHHLHYWQRSQATKWISPILLNVANSWMSNNGLKLNASKPHATKCKQNEMHAHPLPKIKNLSTKPWHPARWLQDWAGYMLQIFGSTCQWHTVLVKPHHPHH